MPIWDDLLTEDERKVYEIFRQPKTLGTRPAILVIDVNYAFVGRKPEHIVESVQDYRTSCGERGWEGVANIQKLLATFSYWTRGGRAHHLHDGYHPVAPGDLLGQP